MSAPEDEPVGPAEPADEASREVTVLSWREGARVEALREAVRWNSSASVSGGSRNVTDGDVVSTAQKFYGFLMGEGA